MIGPKTSITLQRRVTAQAATGAQSVTWRTLQTFKGVLMPKRASETVVYDKQTVFADYELRLDYKDVKREFRADIIETARFTTATDTFKIQGVQNYYNRQYVIDLLRDQAA